MKGGEAVTLPSGGLVLKTPDYKDIRLQAPSGKMTKAGQYYFKKTGESPPSGLYDPKRPLVREGDKEYVQLRNGKRRLARQCDPQQNDFKYSKLGIQVLKERKRRNFC